MADAPPSSADCSASQVELSQEEKRGKMLPQLRGGSFHSISEQLSVDLLILLINFPVSLSPVNSPSRDFLLGEATIIWIVYNYPRIFFHPINRVCTVFVSEMRTSLARYGLGFGQLGVKVWLTILGLMMLITVMWMLIKT